MHREEKSDADNLKYFKALERKELMPQRLGIMRRSEKKLDFRGLGFGDTYTKAISSSLKSIGKKLEKVNLTNNRLSSAGANNLLGRLNPRAIKHVNISENHLGPQAFETINPLL